MGYDPDGTWNWGKFWKVLKVIASVAIVVGAVAVSIMTAGTAVGLIAAGAAIGGALSGAIGGINGIVEAKKQVQIFLMLLQMVCLQEQLRVP